MKSTLRNSFLLSSLSEQDFEQCLGEITPICRCYERGDTINGEQETLRALAFIMRGKVAVYTMQETKRSLLNRFNGGGTFGAATLFSKDEDYRPTTIVACTSCKIVFISERDVMHIIKKYPDAAMSYISFLAGRIRFLNERINSYTTPTAEAKVIKFLMSNSNDDGYVEESFNMKQISSLLGLGRASLYRVLEELEEGGYISRNEGKIKILNIQDLERKIKK